MLFDEHRNYPRAGRRLHEDVSLLTSTSSPVSATHAATTATTTTTRTTATSHAEGPLKLQRQREEQLRHALRHGDPTPAEVSAVASAAYVQALMELIDQHAADVQQINQKIDTLQTQRETYHADLARDALLREAEMQQLRNERADLTLQVQEEQERSTRLLHETTVLYTQQADQKEQLAKLVDLCRARGKRLRAFYHHLKHGATMTRNCGGGGGAGDSEEEGAGRARVTQQPDVSMRDAAETSFNDCASCRMNAAAPSTLPASLSIHRATSSGAAAHVAATGFCGGSADFSLKDIGDDAELAAILRLPYKLQLPTASPSSAPLSGAPASSAQKEGAPAADGISAAATDSLAITVTANAASTAQLLALNGEVNMLRQQLEEQRSTYEEERGARTRDDNERHRRAQEQLAKYAATVAQLEALHEESLRELVHYRHSTEKQLRDVRGQVEWLRGALQSALELAEKDRRQQHNEVYATEQRMSKQYYPKVQSLHSELAEWRRTAAAQARDYAATLAQKDEQIAALQQRVKAESTQRRRVEERYKLEMDGVHSELDLMRQSLHEMERRVYYRNMRDQASEDAEVELERYYR